MRAEKWSHEAMKPNGDCVAHAAGNLQAGHAANNVGRPSLLTVLRGMGIRCRQLMHLFLAMVMTMTVPQ